MPNGSFVKGLAGGIQTGLNYGMNAAQIRWQIEQKKRLEKEKEKMQEVWTNFSQSAQEIYESGEISQETERKLYALLFTLPPELQASANNLLTAVNKNDKAAVEKEFNNLQMVMDVLESTGGRIDDEALDGLINLLNPENQQKITAVMDAYKSVPEQPADIWAQAGKLPQEIRPEFLRARGEEIPEVPPTERAPTAIDQKIAGIEALPIPEDQKLKMKIKVYGGGDTALEQKIQKAYEHGATDEEVKDMIVGRGIDITISPETIGTLGTWEERFTKVKTEDEFNREMNLLEQSEDKFMPEHKTWKEHLVAEVEEMAKALKRYLDEKGNLKNIEWAESYKNSVDIYMEKIMEIQQKFPDVDLSKFPKFRGERKTILTVPYGGLIEEKGW